MEMPLLLQFSIALFTGMVAATLVPPVRRVVPRPIEIMLWSVLVVACVVGVVSITDPRARELTASAFWGVDQIIGTLGGLLGAGLTGWLVENRFTIASWVAVGCGIDIFVLALLRSYRKGRAWQPRVRLYEWMELPRLAPAGEPVQAPYAIDELNRKWAAALAVAGAVTFAWLIQLLIWARDEVLPRQARRVVRAAMVGRAESRAGLEALRDRALLFRFAASAWYTAAGAPAVSSVSARATDAVRKIGAGRGADGGELMPGRMVDIRVLLSAQSSGWYGPMRPGPTAQGEEGEDDSQQAGRLAS
ncbi:MAG TPA: hypothetical protein VNF91_02705 [Candidatus Acidoferrum sp.]|nr:hypothetical protein [Candidatus Acidoferrum sp.]